MDMPPGNYFIVATGLDADTHQTVKGHATVIVRKRFRQNVVDVEISLK